MKKVQQAGVILLVMLVILSTTGITIHDHICACNTAQAAPVHSCCTPVPSPASCCDDHNTATPGDNATGCTNHHKGCKDVPLYFKATIVALPLLKKGGFEFSVPSLELFCQVLFAESPEFPVETVVIPTVDPPPLSGRERVVFLHQLRIPFTA